MANRNEKRGSKPAQLSDAPKQTPSSLSLASENPPVNKSNASVSLAVKISAWLAVFVAFLFSVGYLYTIGFLSHLGIDPDQLVRPSQAYGIKTLYLIDFAFTHLPPDSYWVWLRIVGGILVGVLLIMLVIPYADRYISKRRSQIQPKQQNDIKKSPESAWRPQQFFWVVLGALVFVVTPALLLVILVYVIAPIKIGEESAQSFVSKFIAKGGCSRVPEEGELVGICTRIVNTSEQGVALEMARGLQLAASEKYVAMLVETEIRVAGTASKQYEVRLIPMKDSMTLRRELLPSAMKRP